MLAITITVVVLLNYLHDIYCVGGTVLRSVTKTVSLPQRTYEPGRKTDIRAAHTQKG